MGKKGGARRLPPEAAPANVPSPARWEELRAWSGDNLAAARAIFKDAGSVTGWSRVLIERAKGLLQEGHERRGGQPSADAPEADDRALVVRMEGEVDLLTSPPLLALLLGLDENTLGRSRVVLLDLRGVGFLDMSGCRAMIEGGKALRQRGRTLAVWLRPGSQPERTFLAMSLGTVLRRVESLDDL